MLQSAQIIGLRRNSQLPYLWALLTWKQRNLTSESHINRAELSEFFAENFEVIANERHYGANYDNYLEFLNGYKRNIKKINYHMWFFSGLLSLLSC